MKAGTFLISTPTCSKLQDRALLVREHNKSSRRPILPDGYVISFRLSAETDAFCHGRFVIAQYQGQSPLCLRSRRISPPADARRSKTRKRWGSGILAEETNQDLRSAGNFLSARMLSAGDRINAMEEVRNF
jgi:hypothetical protein